MKYFKKNRKGFTLVELLIAISIIGILSGIIIVGTGGSVEKSKRASALTTAMSVLPELIACQEDGGTTQTPDDNTTGGKNICTTTGHTVQWPSLGNTGWTYSVTAGSFDFDIKKGTTETINCKIGKGSCE